MFSIEYCMFKVSLRRVNFKESYQKNDGAKRLPQIFNSQFSAFGGSGLGVKNFSQFSQAITASNCDDLFACPDGCGGRWVKKHFSIRLDD